MSFTMNYILLMMVKINSIQRYISYLHIAAQAHGSTVHGEVNVLDLADRWSVVGLNQGRGRWAELEQRPRKIINQYLTTWQGFLPLK